MFGKVKKQKTGGPFHSTARGPERALQPALLVLGAALMLLCTMLSQCNVARQPPNVILITLDTTRADRIGCYDCPLADTPVLDAFAKEACLFENAVTSAPLTLPAHASMMTGLTLLGHGIRTNYSFQLEQDFETLAETLANRGFTTAAFVSAFALDERFGLHQGFQHYDDECTRPVGTGPLRMPDTGGPGQHRARGRPLDDGGGISERSATATTARAIEWLETVGTEPLFLWVHYYDPHRPLTPPEPFASATRGTPYDAEISAMDASLGDLLQALRRLEMYENAHVIVLADHGEALGDHGEKWHGAFLYEECMRIPFFWKLPGAGKSRRDSTLVSAIDLQPTILDFLNISASAGAEGISLKKLLLGKDSPERDGLYLETLYTYYAYGWSPLHAWRTEHWKYIDAPTPELYNLSTDPAELHNITSEHLGLAARMNQALREYRLAGGDDAGLPEAAALDPATEARLRTLGYVASRRSGRTPADEQLPDPKDVIQFMDHLEDGDAAIQDKRWDEAIRLFGEVLAERPDLSQAAFGMGLSLSRIQRSQEALVWLTRYLAEDPDDVLALEALGDALYDGQRYREARDAYRRARQQENQMPLIRKQVRAMVQLGEYEQAAAMFEETARAFEPLPAAQELADLAVAVRRLARCGTRHPAIVENDFVAQAETLIRLRLFRETAQLLTAAADRHPEAVIAGLEAKLTREDPRR